MKIKVHIDRNSLKHFLVCFALTILLGVYGACAAAGASVTKEWFDRKSYGHWCWFDLLFDALGIGVGIGLHLLLRYII